jgi:hypothetical protein
VPGSGRGQPSAATSREIRSLRIRGAYLLIEEWNIQWREYQLTNSTGQPMAVLVELPRMAEYELFDTPEPKEHTNEHPRFEVEVPAQGEKALRVQERRLMSRHEEPRRQSTEGCSTTCSKGCPTANHTIRRPSC